MPQANIAVPAEAGSAAAGTLIVTGGSEPFGSPLVTVIVKSPFASRPIS